MWAVLRKETMAMAMAMAMEEEKQKRRGEMSTTQFAPLTPNSISAIVHGNLDLRPLLQVLDLQELPQSHHHHHHHHRKDRYRLLLSDGSSVQQSILASQLLPTVQSGRLLKGSIVQLVDYVFSQINPNGLKVIMVLNMEIIGFSAETIGHPKQLLLVDDNKTPSKKRKDPHYHEESSSSPSTPEPRREAAGANSVTTPILNSTDTKQNDSSCRKPAVSIAYEPSPIYSQKGSISRNQAPARIVPISALNPYQGRWTIKARVTAKGELRRFHTAKSSGKVFSFDLLDADGDEIRATCFNSVADRFLDKVEVGRIYMISKGTLKPVQRNFNHLKNDWEIFLETSSIIEACDEEELAGAPNIPQQRFDFIPIKELENMEGNAVVDVIGVVLNVSSINTILRKNGMETQKQTAVLWDSSGRTIDVTLWGSFCGREGKGLKEACDFESGKPPVLAVKSGRISEFSGKSIGTISTTQLLVDPDIPEAKRLRLSFESIHGNGDVISTHRSLSQEGSSHTFPEIRKSISQIKGEGLGRSGRPDWIAVKASISFIKTDKFWYPACPHVIDGKQCSRKVVKQSDGTWHCDHCGESMAECEHRYLLSLQIEDHTGATWVTAFQEAGEEIVGLSARELYLLKEEDDRRFSDAIRRLLFMPKLFRLKVREETYNNEISVKCTVIKAEELVFEDEMKVLVNMIGRLSKEPIDKMVGGKENFV